MSPGDVTDSRGSVKEDVKQGGPETRAPKVLFDLSVQYKKIYILLSFFMKTNRFVCLHDKIKVQFIHWWKKNN